MGRAQAERERIGEMLVVLGLVTSAQLDEALKAQAATPGRLGKHLVELGHVTETQLTQALSSQLSVPWVSLERIQYSAALLACIPGRVADRFSVMPVYVRGVRGQGETLYVAMDDPTDASALSAIERAARIRVRPMIAPPSEIRRAIERRYFGEPGESLRPEPQALRRGRFGEEVTASGRRPVPPPEVPDKRRVAKAPPPPPPAGAQASPASREDGAVPVEQYAVPSKPPAHVARTLTLLDGTQIKLPSAGSGSAAKPVTLVRHVVKAVAGASADLGDAGELIWHDVVQALLDAVAARGLTLTRREVAEAWATSRQQRAPADAAQGE